MKGKEVAKLIDGGNYIGEMSLRLGKITPKLMDDFLSANHLTWAVASLGPWLGNVAFFYRRTENDTTNVNHNPENSEALTGEELKSIKEKYKKAD